MIFMIQQTKLNGVMLLVLNSESQCRLYLEEFNDLLWTRTCTPLL